MVSPTDVSAAPAADCERCLRLKGFRSAEGPRALNRRELETGEGAGWRDVARQLFQLLVVAKRGALGGGVRVLIPDVSSVTVDHGHGLSFLAYRVFVVCLEEYMAKIRFEGTEERLFLT